MVITQILIHP